jgi:hypothetical protein
MIASLLGLKWGLFCHEPSSVEKLDNGSATHLSWSGAEERLKSFNTEDTEKRGERQRREMQRRTEKIKTGWRPQQYYSI